MIRPSIGFSPMLARTLPGKRSDPIRAWMMVTTLPAGLALEILSGIDFNGLSSDVPGSFRGQKNHHWRDVLRRSQPFDGTFLFHQITDELWSLRLGRSLDETGRYQIDVDIVFTKLRGRRLDQSHQTGLGCVITRAADSASETVDRTDTDNFSAHLLHEVR